MAEVKPLKLVDLGGGAGRLEEFAAGDQVPKAALPALTKTDVGLGSVDNTSDADKPVSTAQQMALDAKAPLASPVFTGNPTAPTPASSDDDTSIATTAFVRAAMALFGLTDPATRQAWHAANLVKQTGPTDTTVGAMLAVGAANLLTASASEGFDVLKGSRFIRAGTDGPLGSTICGGLSVGVTGTIEQQLAMRLGRAFFRSKGDTDSAWRELFHTSNILGTVSQAAGVPTGAIIERGSNANGAYTRYADGTQICTVIQTSASAVNTAAGNVHRTGSNAWTYPAEFVSTPAISGMQQGSPGYAWVSEGSGVPNNTSCTWAAVSPTASSAVPVVGLTAIGRWY